MTKLDWIQGVLAEHEGRLLRYTSRIVGEPAAREIVQEAFLRLWQEDMNSVHSYVRNWLFTVCRNSAFDYRKKEGRLSPFDEGAEAELPATQVDDQTDAKQSHQAVMKLVHKLPEAHREVLRLKFQEDLSYKEIAAITGHSVSYVGVLLHEAILRLRGEMGGKNE